MAGVPALRTPTFLPVLHPRPRMPPSLRPGAENRLSRVVALCLFIVVTASGLMNGALGYDPETDVLENIGVNWGRVSRHPLAPEIVVGLMQRNNITRVRIFQPNYILLQALKNTGIKVMVGTSLRRMQLIGMRKEYSDNFVFSKIRPWVKAGVDIEYLMVGNEPFLHDYLLKKDTMDALDNIRASLDKYTETRAIKTGTPLSNPIENYYPVSAGIVYSEATEVFMEIAKKAVLTRSSLFLNYYPFFATSFKDDGDIFGLNASMGVPGLYPKDAPAKDRYPDLLSVQHDSTIVGFGRLGFPDVDLVITETGWPTEGMKASATNKTNAEIFYKFLLDWSLSGRGTKLRPNRTFLTYAFGLLDEDIKGKAVERAWGIFSTAGVAKFNFTLSRHQRVAVPDNAGVQGLVTAATLDEASIRWIQESNTSFVLLEGVNLTGVQLSQATVYSTSLFATPSANATLTAQRVTLTTLVNVTTGAVVRVNSSATALQLRALNLTGLYVSNGIVYRGVANGMTVSVPTGDCKWTRPIIPKGCSADRHECMVFETKCEPSNKVKGGTSFLVVALIYLLPGLPSILLFPFPKIKRFLDRCSTNRFIISWVVFAGQPVRYFGRYLYENAYATFGYSIFWIIILAAKAVFSYYIEIAPMMMSTRTVLTNPRDYYYELPSGNSGSDLLDFATVAPNNTSSLVVVILILWLPIFLIFLIDLHVFYLFFATILGVSSGFLNKLGLVRSFATVKQKFFMLPNLLGVICDYPVAVKTVQGDEGTDVDVKSTDSPPPSPPSPLVIETPEVGINAAGHRELERSGTLFRRTVQWGRTSTMHPANNPAETVGLTAQTDSRAVAGRTGSMDRGIEVRARSMPHPRRSYSLWGSNREHEQATSDLYSSTGVGLLQSAVDEYDGTSPRKAEVFVHLWNEFVLSLREEDLISDMEKRLMLADIWHPPEGQGPSAQPGEESREDTMELWPLFLLAGSTQEIVRTLMNFRGDSDFAMLQPLKENKRTASTLRDLSIIFPELLRQCVVGEAETKACEVMWEILKDAIDNHKLLANFQMKFVQDIVDMMASITRIMARARANDGSAERLGDKMLKLYNLFTKHFLNRGSPYSVRIKAVVQLPEDAFDARAFFLPPGRDDVFQSQALRLHHLLTLDLSAGGVPTNTDCRRRCVFFFGSLFMKMPIAPEVRRMMSFTTLTPYYAEDVIYPEEKLRKKNTEGVSTLFYLTLYYPDEWRNFLERVDCSNETEAWDKHPMELRLWASQRGQTLARTVRGMMYYNRALALLDYLETASNSQLKNKAWEADEIRTAHSGVAALKFTYVVSCQMYGDFKRCGDPRATEILYLLTRNENLRVAYVEEDIVDGVTHYYSCLIKADKGQEQLVYRIRLPGKMKVGEGKPENQNHAIIFTRGQGLQVIDMNQDNYLEEAYKIRNLLEEFNQKGYNCNDRDNPTILGMREHVFTGSAASVAKFMFSEEITNVTLWFRVLALLRIRLHYGHPDIFDRIWHMPRGGVSKASPIIHVVEDVYGGMNSTLRGGKITHHEYIQVGKGRDVGLFQITEFYAKIINGMGEESLSREVNRISNHCDFFRFLSFYFSHLGLPISYVLVVVNQLVILYLYLFAVFSGIDRDLLDLLADTTGPLGAIASLVQLVLFIATTLFQPVWLNWILEMGFLEATTVYIGMTLLLSPVYFTFLLGTRVHNFSRAIIFGGSKYRATGRNFVIEHEHFDENFRRYSSSHYALAMELLFLIVVADMYGNPFLIIKVLTWFVIVCFLFAPAIFNPSGFIWGRTVADFKKWMVWMQRAGSIGIDPKVSWESWWLEEQQDVVTGGILARLTMVVAALRFFLLQFAITYSLDSSLKKFGTEKQEHAAHLYAYIWAAIGILGFMVWLINKLRHLYAVSYQQVFRIAKFFMLMVLASLLAFVIWRGQLSGKDIAGIALSMISTGWGLVKVGQAMRPTFDWLGIPRALWWPIVQNLAWVYDATLGLLLIVPIGIISWFPFFSSLQDRILYNTAFSGGLAASRIVYVASSKTR